MQTLELSVTVDDRLVDSLKDWWVWRSIKLSTRSFDLAFIKYLYHQIFEYRIRQDTGDGVYFYVFDIRPFYFKMWLKRT